MPTEDGQRMTPELALEDQTAGQPRSGGLRNVFRETTPTPTPAQVQREAEQQAKKAAEHWAIWGAARNGARIVLADHQRDILFFGGSVLLGLVALNLQQGMILLLGLATALYVATGAHKLWLLARGERAVSAGSNGIVSVNPNGIANDDLPAYTVLVPLHREAKIVPTLIEGLKQLDYPTDRLEILLLVELDDELTQSAIRHYPLPIHMRQVTMPPGQPRTKPRALNVGLHEAHGDYIVIYDAEDRPEPDQLRKAAAGFRKVSEQVVCLQARLNFYNREQSLLSRLFSVDYAVWYDQMLPGLTREHAFIPLGGTSNHFRVEILRQIGGWDPFNVTEDCDLGARLSRAGYGILMLDSVTWEEAVTAPQPWIRQRSRWVKGYLQTYLVQMRHPLRLWRDLGWRGFVDFQMLVGGSTLVLLVNPLMWLLTLAYILGAGTPVDAYIETLFPATLYYPAVLSLTLGNFIFFYANAYVCVRHDYISLTRYALLTPFYWLLMSLGAWTGMISLVRNPFYWAKTEHGVSINTGELEAVRAGARATIG
jgi:cellulose synthase/poly-beta-1,6-N-acetylglucosamine synthase-like glycosyltransferase